MNCTDQIAAAFPKLIEASPDFLPNSVTEEELSRLAADIGTFYIEDVPPFLGAILYATAKIPPRDPWQWERLIYYLNVSISDSEIGRDPEEIAKERARRITRQKEFEQLTSAQIDAVRAWLYMAQNWGFKGAIGQEIREAFDFWEKLAPRSERSK